ncbi:uncharacterized protein EAE98_012271 [Botrytis deweyae]|uniref:DNL-type domain-containing protein n=1 Tax=Botrytis deweyae TaxID=2478750 RepID=A0ABQ7I3K1_9HELO|nr:uncharacterized protein EAE98_012271 [Botrytis deweyae]KAF7909192.1 hypothetical protein EAE98_012271 [Botrytis deweyae]
MSLKSSTFAAFRALSRNQHTTFKATPRITSSIPTHASLIPLNHPRLYSTPSKPLTDRSSSSSSTPSPPRAPQPSYELTFTCKPCSARSTHRISKQGYHSGSILITCPSCKNRHVISDHLGIFGDRKLTIEDLMKEKGMLVKKGTLSEDGNLEFWSDGTSTERKREGEEEGEYKE